jgi:serine/threonine-protein kinase
VNIDELLEPGGLFKSALFGTFLRDHVDVVELAPGTRVGPYVIDGPLGSGGMSVVYLGQRADGQFKQRVAIKFLSRRVATSHVHEDFRRERKIVAELNHAHIAHLLDGGVMEDGRLWFATELVDGLPIDAYCVEKKLHLNHRVALLCPIVAAVQYAHARLLIHRDIKPDNVCVDHERGAKLLDFGVAMFADDEDVAIAYTPGYASPEQLAGERVNTSSDIWQLGNLLRVVVSARAEGEKPKPLPLDLQAIIDKACARQISRRYHTAQGLHDDLTRFLAHEPVRARPQTARYRLQRLVQRHPIGCAASIIGMLLFGVLIALSWRLNTAHSVAQNERNITLAVTKFLTGDLIAETNPYGGSGHPVVDLGGMLSKAAQRADTTFADHPHLAEEIDLALATALEGMDRIDDAQKITDRALARLPTADAGEFEISASFRALAAVLMIDTNKHEQAMLKLVDLRDEVVPRLGPEHPLTLHIETLIGLIYHNQQQLGQCEHVLRGVVLEARSLSPFDALIAYTALAECSATLGHYAEAIPMAAAQVRSNAALYGETDPRTLVARTVELIVRIDAGEFERAIDEGQRIAAQALLTLGPNDSIYGDVLIAVGYGAACGGRYELARQNLKLGRELKSKLMVGVSDAVRRPLEIAVAKTRIYEAMLLKRNGDERGAEESLALAASALPAQAQPLEYAQLLLARGELRLAQNRYAEAASDFEGALATSRRVRGIELPRNAPGKLGLAIAYAHLGKVAAAKSLHDEAMSAIGSRATCAQPLIDAAANMFANEP